MSNHKLYMERCIELAEQSVANGDLPFGSLITKDDEVISESGQSVIALSDATNHAEINVLRVAQKAIGNNLSECTLYTNCEPCAMCSFISIELQIGEVVFAVPSPNMGGYTRWDILNDRNAEELSKTGIRFPKVLAGFMQEEASTTFRNYDRELLGLPWGK